MIKGFFKDYNYKKHAKICGIVYGTAFIFDMTVSYVLIRKMIKRQEELEELRKLKKQYDR